VFRVHDERHARAARGRTRVKQWGDLMGVHDIRADVAHDRYDLFPQPRLLAWGLVYASETRTQLMNLRREVARPLKTQDGYLLSEPGAFAQQLDDHALQSADVERQHDVHHAQRPIFRLVEHQT
jgi:hypothetical protein